MSDFQRPQLSTLRAAKSCLPKYYRLPSLYKLLFTGQRLTPLFAQSQASSPVHTAESPSPRPHKSASSSSAASGHYVRTYLNTNLFHPNQNKKTYNPLVVVAFQVLVPRYAEKLAHKFVILAIDILTMLFWFAAFIALAVAVGVIFGPTTDWYKAAQATVAFGAFEW